MTEPYEEISEATETFVAETPSRGTLRRQTVRGVALMGMSFGAQSVLQVVFLAVLARLVTPDEFGLVSGALIAVFFTTVLAESGVGAAIVQRKDLTREHFRCGFTLSLLLGIGCWALLAGLAPQLEEFLRLPGLTPIVRTVALIFVINNLTLSDYLLARRLQFGRLALAESTAYAIGYGGVAVTLAAYGFGAWSIVGGQLGQSTIRTILVWSMAPHPVKPLIARQPMRDIFNFGAWFTVGRVALWAATQADNLVAGRYLGATALGLYGRAYQLVEMPANLFGQVANEVLFPAMASVQDDRATLRHVFRVGISFLTVLALPVSVLAAVTSKPLVLVLFGHKWLPLTAAFDVIVFGMMFRTSGRLTDSLAKATGAVYQRAWRSIVFAGLVFAGAFIGKQWGIHGIAVGVLAALTVNYLLTSQLCVSLVGMSWFGFASAHGPAVVLSVAAGAAGYVTDRLLTGPVHLAALPRLAVVWAVGLTVCAAIVRLAWRTRALGGVAAMATSIHALLDGRPADIVAGLLGRGYQPRLRRRRLSAPLASASQSRS